MQRLMIVFALSLLALTSSAQSNQQWITSASGVRARTMPATSGDEVARLPIGTVLRQMDEEPQEGVVSGKKGFWYHVALPGNKEGWVFSTNLNRFDETRKGEIYKAIAANKINAESGTYAEYADLHKWLTSVLPQVSDRATLAHLELWRWVALQKAFSNIEVDKLQQPEYQRFVKANQVNAVYSEPGGLWLVKADLLWNLQKKYADLPVGDLIAWEAANLPLPGECEGDDTCATMYMNETKGRYLSLYPAGKKMNEAIDGLIESFQGINEQMKHVAVPKGKSKQDQSIRRDALAAIAKMRTNIGKVSSPKKVKLVALLSQYEKFYR